ncbi:MAG: polyprenyl synthetase family protein [Phycisphaerales bacterium]|nr:polyprenyl synthetase family protein [Planctomycetota bacterium]
MPDAFSVLPEIEKALRSYVQGLQAGTNLREAISYSLLSGGKRLRPVLAWHACVAAGGDPDNVLPVCVALELVHCFSLVHDDLPAMDDDDLRRGIPTLHKHAGEAMAILAGDAMMTLAFEPLTGPAFRGHADLSVRLVRELVLATTGMIDGQVYDTIPNTVPGATPIERVKTIHTHKTGALIRAACVMGGLSAEISRGGPLAPDEVNSLGNYGSAIGLMFQIVDDLIDVEQPAALAGKRTGKDAQAGKLTYPVAYGSADRCREEVAGLLSQATASVSRFGASGTALRELASFLATRVR